MLSNILSKFLIEFLLLIGSHINVFLLNENDLEKRRFVEKLLILYFLARLKIDNDEQKPLNS